MSNRLVLDFGGIGGHPLQRSLGGKHLFPCGSKAALVGKFEFRWPLADPGRLSPLLVTVMDDRWGLPARH
jgi:hypothetical protein